MVAVRNNAAHQRGHGIFHFANHCDAVLTARGTQCAKAKRQKRSGAAGEARCRKPALLSSCDVLTHDDLLIAEKKSSPDRVWIVREALRTHRSSACRSGSWKGECLTACAKSREGDLENEAVTPRRERPCH